MRTLKSRRKNVTRLIIAAALSVTAGYMVYRTGLAADYSTVAVSPSASPAVGTGRILFEDDFNGPSGTRPNAAKWVNYGSWCKTPEGITVDQPGFGYISCEADKHLDGNGNLVLPATPKQGSGVQSATKFGFVYGEVSAWMKMPKEVGYWPAFWTLNGLNGPQGQVVGEADIVEYYTTWPDTYHAGLHSHNSTITAAKPGSKDNYCKLGVDLTSDFHKYTARIEPGKVTFTLDGKFCATEVSDTFEKWPFAPDIMTGNWLILNNAIGGAGGAQTPASANSQVLVSRVEVRSIDAGSTPTSTPASTPTKTPTPSPTVRVAGDLNQDGRVNVLDLSILLSQFGLGAGGDLNGDGKTNILDLSIILVAWSF